MTGVQTCALPILLISPVTEPGVTTWRTYLPKQEGGWTDYRTGEHYEGGQYLLEKEITILGGLNSGDAKATAWGCDLTYDYVKINGDYRS